MLNWIRQAVFYEIYPTSFYDSNADGIGDLKGIEQKLDYLKTLGVDCIWLNPIFKSPFQDGGYDISDYYEIDKRFGTMEDLESLIKACKQKGLRLVLDLVIGHTSNKHPWFKKSALVKRNGYSDYYIWTDSLFQSYPGLIRGLHKRDGGYLPNYYASQPALNFGFENKDPLEPWKLHYTDDRLKPLRDEILNIMRFYLDKGVDGFRVDMASSLIKEGATFSEEALYDNSDAGLSGIKWFWNQVLGQLRSEYSDKVYIAEWVLPQRSIGKCGFDMDFLTHDTIPFNSLYRYEKGCNLGDSDYYVRGHNYFSPDGLGSLDDFANYTEFLYQTLGDRGMFSAPTSTHDEIRMPTGKSEDLVKTVFAFLLTLKQIPFIYYGDELGMEHNFHVSKDGGGIRTGARTPMQWTEEKGRGFSTKKTTYLPASPKKGATVEAQTAKEDSIYCTVRKLIGLRKTCPCLFADAGQTFLETGYPAVYERSDGKDTVMVMINPSDKELERSCEHSKILLSQNAEAENSTIRLKAQSFIILQK